MGGPSLSHARHQTQWDLPQENYVCVYICTQTCICMTHWKTDSLEKTLMLGKSEGGRRRGQQGIRWLDGITHSMDMS